MPEKESLGPDGKKEAFVRLLLPDPLTNEGSSFSWPSIFLLLPLYVLTTSGYYQERVSLYPLLLLLLLPLKFYGLGDKKKEGSEEKKGGGSLI